MTDTNALAEQLQQKFGDSLQSVTVDTGEVTVEVAPDKLVEVATALRDELGFEMLIDLCGVDYAGYGRDEWQTQESSGSGFSRGVDAATPGRMTALDDDLCIEKPREARRFAAV
jgi:NADH-quinone oxidoreductase subunit C